MMSSCKSCLEIIKGKTSHEGYHDDCLRQLFGSVDVSPVLPFTSEGFYLRRGELSEGMSISGAQAKLSAVIRNNQLELTSKGGQFILKPTPPEYPELALNEHLSMNLARLMGINVPPLALLRFADTDEYCYAIRRFDRDVDNSEVIAQVEDMMQIMNKHRESENSKYESDYVSVSKAIKMATNNKRLPLLDYFNRIVHSFLVGNGDLHLKNISLIKDVVSTKHSYDILSPHYDVVNSHVYDNKEHVFALDMFPDDADVPTPVFDYLGFETGAELRLMAEHIGLSSNLINTIIKKALETRDSMIKIVGQSYLSSPMQQQYLQILEDRFTRLERASV